MNDTNETVFDRQLTAKELRLNAKLICKQVKSNPQLQVLIYQCDECGKPHIRFIDDDGHAAAETNESIH